MKDKNNSSVPPSLLIESANDTTSAPDQHRPAPSEKSANNPSGMSFRDRYFTLPASAIALCALVFYLAPDRTPVSPPITIAAPAQLPQLPQMEVASTLPDFQSPKPPEFSAESQNAWSAAIIVAEPPATPPAVQTEPPVAPVALPVMPAITSAPSTPPPKTAAPVRRPKVAPATDVDVLIALMQYSDEEDADTTTSDRKALNNRLKACPAANTEAGIRCRQRICTDLPGKNSLCPTKTP